MARDDDEALVAAGRASDTTALGRLFGFLQIVFSSLVDGRVPPIWQKAFPSIKNLSSW